MSPSNGLDDLEALVGALRALPSETETLEFKSNDAEPKSIGEYISAIANACAVLGRARGYVVWGVHDGDHQLIGTTFDPRTARKGSEALEGWLHRLLEPSVDFRFLVGHVGGQKLVALEIPRATHQPVRFHGEEYIRIGSSKRRLREFPEMERVLWRSFDRSPFEQHVAAERVPSDDVLRLLDCPAYFRWVDQPLPQERDGVLTALTNDRLIAPRGADEWDILNLGAALFAKRLEDFAHLSSKSVRVIQYSGTSKSRPLNEHERVQGYAAGFDALLTCVESLLQPVPMFPMSAVRELLANAMAHQDFAVKGSGPRVEIFENRIEFTNPGAPLVDPERFLDSPPRSRNEALASLMRRFGVRDERGRGIDKVVAEVEALRLPAPLFEASESSTRAILFAARPLAAMDRAERVRACYLHACLLHEQRSWMTNSSLLARFGIEERDRPIVSRWIREALDAGVVVPMEPDAAPESMRFLPAWARPQRVP